MQFQILILFLLPLTLVSQSSNYADQGKTRPKIGLALSGGSAHGFAHIGVIKYMEELGIPIDYITGTSMGSVVGGLTAMGYSADKMKFIASFQDWESIMSNNIPYDEISPIEKRLHQRSPIVFYFKDKRFTLPSGFIKGQKLDLIISRLYGPAFDVTDFDKLQIPFKCYAIDIARGDIVELDNGYLGKAVRASMAIPSVFTPVVQEDKLLVDGGVIRNFPVENVISMGSDFTIGVYVGRKPPETKEIKSLLDVLTQTAFLYSIKDSEEQATLCDIYIEPDVKHLNSFDFENYEEIIRAGYIAAKAHSLEFLELKKKIIDYDEAPKVSELNLPASFYINSLDMGEIDEPMENLILQKFAFAPQRFLSLQQIEEGISRIYGTKLFDRVSYTFEEDQDKFGLNIVTQEAKRAVFGFTANYFQNTNTSIILSAGWYNTLSSLSRLNLSMRLSELPGFQLDYSKRLKNKVNYIINFSSKIEKQEIPFIYDGKIERLYNAVVIDNFIKGQWEPDNALLTSVGIGYEYRSMKPKVPQILDLDHLTVGQVKGTAEVIYDKLNKEKFATSGYRVRANGSIVFARNGEFDFSDDEAVNLFALPDPGSYTRLAIKGQYALSIGSRLSLTSRAMFAINSRKTIIDDFFVGGTSQTTEDNFPFIGLDDHEMIMSQFFALRQEVRLSLLSKVYISGIVNYLNGESSISTLINGRDIMVEKLGYGVSLGLDLPIGPLEFDIGFTNQDKDRVNTTLGVGFRHIY